MGTLSLSFSRCRLGRAEHFLKTLWFSLRVMGSVVGGVCWRWGIISQQGHSFQQVAPHPPPPPDPAAAFKPPPYSLHSESAVTG